MSIPPIDVISYNDNGFDIDYDDDFFDDIFSEESVERGVMFPIRYDDSLGSRCNSSSSQVLNRSRFYKKNSSPIALNYGHCFQASKDRSFTLGRIFLDHSSFSLGYADIALYKTPSLVLGEGAFIIDGEIKGSYSSVIYGALVNNQAVILKVCRVAAGSVALGEAEDRVRALYELNSFTPQLLGIGHIRDGILGVATKRYTGDLLSLINNLHENYKMSLAHIRGISYKLLELISLMNRAGYTHGDIRPENIVANFEEKNGILIITDIKLIDFEESIVSRDRLYTPGYLPPEGKGTFPAERSADIWSMGAVLYYLITKQDFLRNWNHRCDCDLELNLLKWVNSDDKESLLIEWFKQDGVVLNSNIEDQSSLIGLIIGMLGGRPEERFSMEDCLGHHFFSEEPLDEIVFFSI